MRLMEEAKFVKLKQKVLFSKKATKAFSPNRNTHVRKPRAFLPHPRATREREENRGREGELELLRARWSGSLGYGGRKDEFFWKFSRSIRGPRTRIVAWKSLVWTLPLRSSSRTRKLRGYLSGNRTSDRAIYWWFVLWCMMLGAMLVSWCLCRASLALDGV